MADKCFDSAAASDLLCAEAESTCFDDDDDDLEAVAEVVDEEIHQANDKDSSFGNDRSELLIPFPCLSEEKFLLMVDKERDHLPKDDYLERLRTGDMDMSVRTEALDWILKVCLINFLSLVLLGIFLFVQLMGISIFPCFSLLISTFSLSEMGTSDQMINSILYQHCHFTFSSVYPCTNGSFFDFGIEL